MFSYGAGVDLGQGPKWMVVGYVICEGIPHKVFHPMNSQMGVQSVMVLHLFKYVGVASIRC